MSMLAMPLPLVCAPAGRFASPPWDRHSPDWQRLDAKLPADHLARRVDRAVAQLDLRAVFAAYAGTGSHAHRPDLILKAVLYEVRRGRRSPAQWWEDLLLDDACQWLAFGVRPARSRLYAFRDRLGPLLLRLHNQLIGAAVAEGLTQASQASLDGSTIAANASRHRLLNEESLGKRRQALAQASQAQATPAEPAQAAAAPGWMATTPAGRQAQAKRYETAQAQLAARLAENQKRPASKRLAAKDVRISAGDTEAALGLDKFKVYRPLYNVQWLPDLNTPLVLAYGVFAQATDAGTLPPLLQRCYQATGRYPDELLTDPAYATALDLAACDEAGVTLLAPPGGERGAARPGRKSPKQIPKEEFQWDAAQQVYVCPQGHRLEREYSEVVKRKGDERLRVYTYRCAAEHCGACPRNAECARTARGRTIKRSEHEELVEALARRMQTAEAKALYRRRSQTVELGFADVKEHRGLRRFGGRGRQRAETEVGLVALAHNVLAVLDLRQQQEQTHATPGRSTA